MKAEVADLMTQKDHLHREVCMLKEEITEVQAVKRCVEQGDTADRAEKREVKDPKYIIVNQSVMCYNS